VRSGFAQDNAWENKHFQQKCAAVLRRTMRGKMSISSTSAQRFLRRGLRCKKSKSRKVDRGFAQDNAAKESNSRKSG
jgi:hypothetical protein